MKGENMAGPAEKSEARMVIFGDATRVETDDLVVAIKVKLKSTRSFKAKKSGRELVIAKLAWFGGAQEWFINVPDEDLQRVHEQLRDVGECVAHLEIEGPAEGKDDHGCKAGELKTRLVALLV